MMWKQSGKDTWRKLVAAIAHPNGGNNLTLAEAIAHEHPYNPPPTPLGPPASDNYVTDPFRVPHMPSQLDICSPIDCHQQAAAHDLVEEAWYHGRISYLEAQKRLEAFPDGYFLVRDSTSSPGNYVLTMMHNGEPIHFLVEFSKNPQTYEIHGSRISFEYLQDLVHYYTTHPITAKREKLLHICPNP